MLSWEVLMANARLLTVCGVVLLFGSLAAGQSKGKEPENPTPLAGPRIDEKTAGPTLVRYDMSNRLRRLTDASPEEAALELLRLSEEEKGEVAHVLTERAGAVDEVVGSNLPLLLEATLARDANDRKALREHLAKLYEKFATVRERGALKDEIAYVLTDEHAAAFRTLVDDYWKAVVRDELKGRTGEMEGEKGRAIVVREALMAFGTEIRRSYERQVAQKTAQLEELIARVEATPEQGEKIRQITSAAFQAAAGKPTLQQKRETFAKVMKVLTREQQRVVLAELYGAGGGGDEPDR